MAETDYVAESTAYTNTYDFYRRGLLQQQSVWINDYVIPVLLPMFTNDSLVRILAVGSGEGDIDIMALDALRIELVSKGIQNTRIEYFVVERNPDFVDRFKKRLKTKESDFSNVDFRFCVDTLEHLGRELDGVQFNFIHLIHALYYMDAKKILYKCMHEWLSPSGVLLAVAQQEANLYAKNWRRFSSRFHKLCGNFNLLCETDLATIANMYNWNHRIERGKRVIDVSDIVGNDSPTPAGWKLLDFFFHTNDLAATINDKELKEVIEFFKENTVLEGGRFLAIADETIAFIFK